MHWLRSRTRVVSKQWAVVSEILETVFLREIRFLKVDMRKSVTNLRRWLILGMFLLMGCRLVGSSDEQRGITAVSPPPPTPTENTAPTGRLLFVRFNPEGQSLVQFDIRTKEQIVLYTADPQALLSHVDVSPDGKQVVMAYAPPPSGRGVQFGYSRLYTLPVEGGEPVLLLTGKREEEIFFTPVWSPDGRFIYYAHVSFTDAQLTTFTTTLERLEVVTEKVEVLVEDGIWPRLSADGQQLAYVHQDKTTQKRSLYVAEADGTNPNLLVTADTFSDVDAPFFSPDGRWVYFGAVLPPVGLAWFDRLLGVKTAIAHNVPSDWWRIPVMGGQPEQVTTINAVGMYGSFDPNGRTIAFASQTGLYLMNLDGTNLTYLLETAAASTLAWIP